VKPKSEGGGGEVGAGPVSSSCFRLIQMQALGPRSCDFEVVSLIKELIKEKLHGSEQITEKRKEKGQAKEEIKEQIYSEEIISTAHQFLKWHSVVLLIGRGASWQTGNGHESCKRKAKCVNTAAVV